MPSPLRERTCEWCKAKWQTRKPDARTCNAQCRARLRETEKPTKGRPEREYSAELVKQVIELYEGGMSKLEVQEAVGPGVKTELILKRYGAKMRGTAKRNQAGAANHMWRADKAGYQALHLRVQSARGKPSYCAACDISDPHKRYEWANLTGHYADLDDYVRLCVACHRKADTRMRYRVGGPLSAHIKRGRTDE